MQGQWERSGRHPSVDALPVQQGVFRMRKLMLASAATFAIALAVPAVAQQTQEPQLDVPTLYSLDAPAPVNPPNQAQLGEVQERGNIRSVGGNITGAQTPTEAQFTADQLRGAS